jgi:branched-chain amino acid transport system substrate-binding protein
MIQKAGLAVALSTLLAFSTAPTKAQISDDVVRIGVLADMSGIYNDLSGKGAVEAVRMAVEDFGGTVLGKKIDVVFADHLNKPDVGAAKAREWFDTGGVDLINDLANSGVALAVAAIAKEKKRHIVVNGASNMGITNAVCSPYTIHYAYDAYSLANGTGQTVVEQGGKTWFFLTVDFAFGVGLEAQVSDVVRKNKGRVVGAARHPLATTDFSSYVLQAQASKAEIIGIASTGADAVNAIKAAKEFGATKNVGKMPNMAQAADYSSTMFYLNAVKEAGTDDPDKVSAKMREMKINDMFTKNGYVRVDGRMVHDMYLWQVKTPAESKAPWDYLKAVATIPAERAFQPLDQSTCYLVKK